MKHNHCDHCDHNLKHCKHCDVAYCTKCSKEWPSYRYSYGGLYTTTAPWLGQTTTTSTSGGTVAYDPACAHDEPEGV